MAFLKKGTPVKFNIISKRCSCCGKDFEEIMIINGKSICEECYVSKLQTTNN